MNFKF